MRFLTFGSDLEDMLFFQVWEKNLPALQSTHSTLNSVEKMLASLAPYPLRPPVVFFSSSSKFDPVRSCPVHSGNEGMLAKLKKS